ncbi:MAG: transporter associated domain-containing protein [Anaerolineales bacterium]|nr:transporter associated domain-containing protein [Anaerolineales bacterium]
MPYSRYSLLHWNPTIAGLVMALMQRIPSEGDRCNWAGVGYKILDMDDVRVDKVLVDVFEDDRPSLKR